MTDRTPDQLKLPVALWTREAVRDLIAQRTGLAVSARTAGRYLKRWGFTPQKPLRRAYERDPVAVERWKRAEYPAIVKQAKAENAEIHWGDQLGAQRSSSRPQLRPTRRDAGDPGHGTALPGQHDVEHHQPWPSVLPGLRRLVQRRSLHPLLPSVAASAAPARVPDRRRSPGAPLGRRATGCTPTDDASACSSCPATAPNSIQTST
ncbi:MAG: winged helix-turn-helix domain-containing protein [Phycisphaerales bacterium]|nr:winged helix-turn-helix domain-containing protein [Phycisphaerales bacterium]